MTVSVEEYALARGISSRTVYRAIARGELEITETVTGARIAVDEYFFYDERPTYAPKTRVFSALLARRVSVKALAKRLRADRRYVYHVIAGVAGRRGRKAQKIREGIAAFLKIPYDELWGNGDGAAKGGKR